MASYSRSPGYGMAGKTRAEIGQRPARSLTTTPNALTSAVHDRMPVILPRDAYDLWLDPGRNDVQVVSELLKPYDANSMRRYPVSMRVNRVENDDQECAQPVVISEAQNRLFV